MDLVPSVDRFLDRLTLDNDFGLTMMDPIEVDKSLYDIVEGDIKDLWGSDSFDSNIEDMPGLGSETDWANLLDNQPIILHDRMMSDAVQSPRIQSEHSYSLTVADEMPDSPLGLAGNIKLEDHYSKDMDNDCFPMTMSSTPCQSDFSGIIVKQEPASPPPASSPPHFKGSCVTSLLQQSLNSSSNTSSSSHPHLGQQQSVLKPPTILLATRPQSNFALNERRLMYPKFNIKLESMVSSSSGFSLPPTPPSSTGSDSEGSLSPVHGSTHPMSPPSLLLSSSSGSSSSSSSSKRSSSNGLAGGKMFSSSGRSSSSSCSPLISNQPKGATGVLMLTDEEKRTLMAEGYPIPQRLPLTKAEERSLKKIRRKIKNKISAQESRRKKKEYMDSLEKRVEILNNENTEYKRRMETLDVNNKSLLSQLQKLQELVGDYSDRRLRTTSTQTHTCLEEQLMQDDTDSFVHSVEMMELVDGQCR